MNNVAKLSFNKPKLSSTNTFKFLYNFHGIHSESLFSAVGLPHDNIILNYVYEPGLF